jgi:hypothetical protein
MKPDLTPTEPTYGRKYGTAEWYESMFADILADAANNETVDQNKETIENILNGFEAAIKSWLRYHSHAVDSYRLLLEKYSK